MIYKTVMHATRNEKGDEEVELVYERGFWRWLLRMPERKEIYVKSCGTSWSEKSTGETANLQKQYEIITVTNLVCSKFKEYGEMRSCAVVNLTHAVVQKWLLDKGAH